MCRRSASHTRPPRPAAPVRGRGTSAPPRRGRPRTRQARRRRAAPRGGPRRSYACRRLPLTRRAAQEIGAQDAVTRHLRTLLEAEPRIELPRRSVGGRDVEGRRTVLADAFAQQSPCGQNSADAARLEWRVHGQELEPREAFPRSTIAKATTRPSIRAVHRCAPSGASAISASVWGTKPASSR